MISRNIDVIAVTLLLFVVAVISHARYTGGPFSINAVTIAAPPSPCSIVKAVALHRPFRFFTK